MFLIQSNLIYKSSLRSHEGPMCCSRKQHKTFTQTQRTKKCLLSLESFIFYIPEEETGLHNILSNDNLSMCFRSNIDRLVPPGIFTTGLYFLPFLNKAGHKLFCSKTKVFQGKAVSGNRWFVPSDYFLAFCCNS